jgi:hypothetical protein
VFGARSLQHILPVVLPCSPAKCDKNARILVSVGRDRRPAVRSTGVLAVLAGNPYKTSENVRQSDRLSGRQDQVFV